MNRRFKNRLIDLAFNDLSQEESAKLEAKANKSPKAANELQRGAAPRGCETSTDVGECGPERPRATKARSR